MSELRFAAKARVIIGSALAVGMLLFPSPSSGQIEGPLPPIKKPPNLVPLTPVEQFGKDIVFDITLSNPPGYACFTCHTPETGHASPGPPDGIDCPQQPGPALYGNRLMGRLSGRGRRQRRPGLAAPRSTGRPLAR
jgi:cytochrome c peroxidase